MTGGSVNLLVGGGLHKSQVGTANIVIEDGTIPSQVLGGGASSLTGTQNNCGCTSGWYNGDPEQGNCRVDKVNITVNGGSIPKFLYGGSDGYGYTGEVNMEINGGNMGGYVTLAGSNGYTVKGTLTVNGGKIKTLQGVNHCYSGHPITLGDYVMTITGGEIAKMYVGGELADDVVGMYNSATASINGGTVTYLYPGSNGVKNTSNTDKLTVSYVQGTVTTVSPDFGGKITELVNVSFMEADGTKIETRQFVAGGLIDYKPAEKTGYTFAGWYTDKALTQAWKDTDTVSAHTTLYAKWNDDFKTVTVHYNYKDAPENAIYSVRCGAAVEKPLDPSRDMYKFVGWYDAAEGGSAWDFSQPVTADMDLYAHWTEDFWTVTLHHQDGKTADKDIYAVRGTPAANPGDPSREGYTFDGWYTEDTYKNKWNFSDKVTGDMDLYLSLIHI